MQEFNYLPHKQIQFESESQTPTSIVKIPRMTVWSLPLLDNSSIFKNMKGGNRERPLNFVGFCLFVFVLFVNIIKYFRFPIR